MNETWRAEIREPSELRVFEALADSRWEYRTIDGLSEATGLDRASVERIVSRYPKLIRRAPLLSAEGRTLYTLRAPDQAEQLAVLKAFVSKSST